jgi:hypothetical protein
MFWLLMDGWMEWMLVGQWEGAERSKATPQAQLDSA